MDCATQGCQGKFSTFDGKASMTPIAEEFNAPVGGSDSDPSRGQNVLMLMEGLVLPADMSTVKVNAVACENERLTL